MEVKERIISRFRLETLKNIMEKLRKAYIIRRTIKALNKKDTILEIEKEIIDINNVVKTKVATSNTDVFFREKAYNFLINNNEKDEANRYLSTLSKTSKEKEEKIITSFLDTLIKDLDNSDLSIPFFEKEVNDKFNEDENKYSDV